MVTWLLKRRALVYKTLPEGITWSHYVVNDFYNSKYCNLNASPGVYFLLADFVRAFI